MEAERDEEREKNTKLEAKKLEEEVKKVGGHSACQLWILQKSGAINRERIETISDCD